MNETYGPEGEARQSAANLQLSGPNYKAFLLMGET
jgi:hypothetical protein